MKKEVALSTHELTLTIHLSGCKEGLQSLRDLATGICKKRSLDHIQMNRIVLALDELFANIHEHGYTNQGGDIECSGSWIGHAHKPAQLEVILRDYAPVIRDLNSLHGVAPETLKENPVAGGLGLYLIRATTAKFEHRPLADGNHWRLLFNVQQEKEHKQ